MTCMERTGQDETLTSATFYLTGSITLSALPPISIVLLYGPTAFGDSAFMQDTHTAHISISAGRLSMLHIAEDTVGG